MSKPPDTTLVAITCADDTVCVMAFVTTEYDSNDEVRWTRMATKENVDAEIERMSAAFDPAKLPVKSWKFVERSEIPEDRTYRDALRHSPAKGFSHDLPHARELHRGLLRAAREPHLARLDVEYQRADETGDAAEKARIAAEKQALRDAPADPAILKAKTTDELKKVWPADLPGEPGA